MLRFIRRMFYKIFRRFLKKRKHFKKCLLHCQERIKERYNLSLSKKDYLKLSKKIYKNRLYLKGEKSKKNPMIKIEMEIKEKKVKLVYDRFLKRIITFLPNNSFNKMCLGELVDFNIFLK